MASSFARLRHEFAQCVGDAIAWRVGVKGAHEFAFRVHDVKVGTVVHDVVFGARSSLMGCPVGPVFLGDRGDLLRNVWSVTVVPSGAMSVNGPPIVTGDVAAHDGWLIIRAMAKTILERVCRPRTDWRM